MKKRTKIILIVLFILWLIGSIIPQPEVKPKVEAKPKPHVVYDNKLACSSTLSYLALADVNQINGVGKLPGQLEKSKKLATKDLKLIISNIQETAKMTTKDIMAGDATKVLADAMVIGGYVDELHTYCKKVLR